MKKTLAFIAFTGIWLLSCKSTKECMGEPKPDQICTMIYDPVCGCDGKTYASPCTADASGVKKWTKGECK